MITHAHQTIEGKREPEKRKKKKRIESPHLLGVVTKRNGKSGKERPTSKVRKGGGKWEPKKSSEEKKEKGSFSDQREKRGQRKSVTREKTGREKPRGYIAGNHGKEPQGVGPRNLAGKGPTRTFPPIERRRVQKQGLIGLSSDKARSKKKGIGNQFPRT